MASREYGRKPQMNFVNRYGVGDDYLSMKDAVTKSEVNSRWSEKDSEFEKPYAEGIEYSEMQHFHPSSYGLDDMSLTRTRPTPGPGLCDGAFMDAWTYVKGVKTFNPTVPCGSEPIILVMEGHDGQGDIWGSKIEKYIPTPEKAKALLEMGVDWHNRVKWVASPLPLYGTLSDDIYTPPPCSQLQNGWDITENISGFTTCGYANVVITVEGPETSCPVDTVIVTGSDTPVVGTCYSASGGTAPYTWSVDKGTINASTGCITSTTGVCGMVTITATDACGNVGTKMARLPTGVWSQISDTTYCSPSGSYYVECAANPQYKTRYYLRAQGWGCRNPPYSCNPNYGPGCIPAYPGTAGNPCYGYTVLGCSGTNFCTYMPGPCTTPSPQYWGGTYTGGCTPPQLANCCVYIARKITYEWKCA